MRRVDVERWTIPDDLRAAMVEVARRLRREATPSEATLWRRLRGRQLDGLKFRRQQPIGPFVVDFFCAEARLIVEVDGPIHDDQVEPDRERQDLLERLGLRVVRFGVVDVEERVGWVLEAIRAATPHPPAPSPTRGEGE